jgi:hypothetical protein
LEIPGVSVEAVNQKVECLIREIEERKAKKLISADKTAERLDLSASTMWRLERDGLLIGCRIYSKKYYTLDSVAEFERRALAGEFSRSPRGAAASAGKRNRSAEPKKAPR